MANILVKPDAIQDMKFTTVEAIDPGTAYFVDGLHGVVRTDAASGDEAILDVSQRTWQMDVSGLSVSKGDYIYINTTTGALGTTDTDRLFGIVVSEPDDNDIADVLIAPQSDVVTA